MSAALDTAKQTAANDPRLYPRLRAFAIALTGSMRAAARLARAVANKLERGDAAKASQADLVLQGYREVYALWMEQTAAQSPDASDRADPRCFALPASTHELAAQYKGLAQTIASLPAQQRATLLLIYGEGLSYDEAAEVFDTTVQVVMTRAVRGHVAVGHWLDRREGSPVRPEHGAGVASTGDKAGRAAERVA